jgi:hypothetical protein
VVVGSDRDDVDRAVRDGDVEREGRIRLEGGGVPRTEIPDSERSTLVLSSSPRTVSPGACENSVR